jgi:hypothetical protein
MIENWSAAAAPRNRGMVLERAPEASLRVMGSPELLGKVMANQTEIRFHDQKRKASLFHPFFPIKPS